MTLFEPSAQDPLIISSPGMARGAACHEVDFNGFSFEGWDNFAGAQFLSKANFQWAKISGRVWFRGYEDNPAFHGEADFTRLQITPTGDLSFESLSFAKASFLHTDLSQLRVNNIQWGKSNRRFGGRTTKRRRLYDESLLTQPNTKQETYEAVGDNYRQF